MKRLQQNFVNDNNRVHKNKIKDLIHLSHIL